MASWLCVACWPYQAAAQAYVPDVNQQLPYYYSGTNCRARGTVYAVPMPGAGKNFSLQWAILYVGPPGAEEPVRTWVHSSSDPPLRELSLAAMFDASHFPSADTLSVKIVAEDNRARGYMASGTVSVKNWAWCWNQGEFDSMPGGDGASVADAALYGMGYESEALHGSWSAVLFGQLLRGSVIFVHAHSNQGFHESGAGFPETIWAGSNANEVDYVEWRQVNNGTGFPPFNSSLLPPVNLLLLQGCRTCYENTDFFSALNPGANAYTDEIMEDQAVHGYTVYVFTQDSENTTSILMDALAAGKSIIGASNALLVAAEEAGIVCSDVEGGPTRPLNQLSDRAILGDPATTIKNVYTGSTIQSTAWYRNIN